MRIERWLLLSSPSFLRSSLTCSQRTLRRDLVLFTQKMPLDRYLPTIRETESSCPTRLRQRHTRLPSLSPWQCHLKTAMGLQKTHSTSVKSAKVQRPA